jgi:hypothetical protein
VRRAGEGVAKSPAFGEVVLGEEHELNPDQGKSSPPKPTMSVLKAVVEFPAHRGVGKDDDAKDLDQDDVGDDEGNDRGLESIPLAEVAKGQEEQLTFPLFKTSLVAWTVKAMSQTKAETLAPE